MKNNNYVVYAYSRIDGTFYYIGKGRPKRPYDGHRIIKKPDDRNRIHILHQGLDEKTAYDYEKKLIFLYGRVELNPDWGILRNFTEGGEGGNGAKPRYFEDWYHVKYGEVKNKSVGELSRMFPDQSLCISMLTKVRKGLKSQHKLWTLATTPENSKRSFAVGEKFEWYHKDHGVLCLTQVELAKKFNLESGHLSAVTLGKLNHFRGWTLASTPELSKYKNLNGSKISWYHEKHGEVFCTQTELMLKFPGMDLTSSALSLVSRGKRNHHKGWRAEVPD